MAAGDTPMADFAWKLEEAGWATLPELLLGEPDSAELREQGMSGEQAEVGTHESQCT